MDQVGTPRGLKEYGHVIGRKRVRVVRHTIEGVMTQCLHLLLQLRQVHLQHKVIQDSPRIPHRFHIIREDLRHPRKERQCRFKEDRNMERIRLDQQPMMLASTLQSIVRPQRGQCRLHVGLCSSLYETRHGLLENTRKLVLVRS